MATDRTLKGSMTPELWQQLKPFYQAATELSEDKRAEFVAGICKDRAELGAALDELLRANAQLTDSFDDPLIHIENLYPTTKDELSAGDVVLERFRIVRRIGAGGMGEVYEAEDLDLNRRRIALKIILPAIANNPAILNRFKEEVILARQVSGPHICRIHEFFTSPSLANSKCSAFLTMEFLEGRTLADKIDNEGPLSAKETLDVATQLCAALQCIHDAGVIHRDLKPRNIMLVSRNEGEKLVVMDFGLARVFARQSNTMRPGLTLPGTVMGTPEYMAPEQFEGREVSPATDIYAVGVVFYELITGRRPFVALTPVGAAVRRGDVRISVVDSARNSACLGRRDR